jgi:hypothetical protein
MPSNRPNLDNPADTIETRGLLTIIVPHYESVWIAVSKCYLNNYLTEFGVICGNLSLINIAGEKYVNVYEALGIEYYRKEVRLKCYVGRKTD